MKTINILTILASALTVAKCYEVNCSSQYQIKENDDCFKIINQNQISLNLFNTINPDIDCENLTVGNTVCVDGRVNISTDGTCGPNKGSCPFGECCSKNGFCGSSDTYCGVGCNPQYGICGSVDNTQDENEVVLDYDQQSINNISSILFMSKAEAKEFYDAANEAMSYYDNAYIDSVDANLSVPRCQSKCSRAYERFENFVENPNNSFNLEQYNQYLTSTGKSSISNTELLELCNNKCYIIKELNEYIEENGGNEIITEGNEGDANLTKRDGCTHDPTEAKISVTFDYLNGYNKYVQAPGSVPTALSKVNGCSIPVIKDLYNSENNGLFVPACNSHDICYGCQRGKDNCDSIFLSNMQEICRRLKDNSKICLGEAQLFYTAVKIGAKKNYNVCKDNETSLLCAYCGAPVIKSTLLYKPYYTA